jgi:hypothetical protein
LDNDGAIRDAAEGASGERAEQSFKARFDRIVGLGHPLARLAATAIASNADFPGRYP